MHHGPVSPAIAKGLKVLHQRIAAAGIPSSKLDESITLATWNIREFGKKKRTEAAVHYLAEILGLFDLISVVELRDNLGDLNRVLTILGPYWRVVYSDSIPDDGGNGERLAFVYDKRAVTFTGFAAEANPPRVKEGEEYLSEITWWRSPYMASFRAGNFDFVVLSTHIRWGSSEASRVKELTLLADWVEARRAEPTFADKDMLVMGDFNIPSRKSPLFKAITRNGTGLGIPSKLLGLTFGTDLKKVKHYDQILHYPTFPENFSNAGGVLDFYAGDSEPLFPGMSKEKFTYQMSDHLPLWIQINTDIDGQLLDQIIKG